MSNTPKKEPLLIIDGYGFIFRAYHVQPPLTSPDGRPVGAIYGLTSMLIKLLSDLKPKYAVMVLDRPGKNFRHDLYEQYKANRPPAPEDLKQQLQLVEEAANALNFRCISKDGFEADDIIATLAHESVRQDHPAIVISADKDLMQLVNHNVRMYDPAKYRYIEQADIIKKFGVGADKVREVQALIGDKSDNIPGVPSVGPKTAAQLINDYGSVDEVLASIDKLTPRQQKLFTEHKEAALISWQLVGLDDNVDVELDFEKFAWEAPDVEKISNFIHQNGFKSLIKRTENLFKLKLDDHTPIEEPKNTRQIDIKEYSLADEKALAEFLRNVNQTGCFAAQISSDNNLECVVKNVIYKLPLEKDKAQNEDLFSYEKSKDTVDIKRKIFALFSDIATKKITWDIKNLLQKLPCEVRACEDLMLMDYVLNAGNKNRTIADIMDLDEQKLNHPLIYYSECYNILLKKLIEQKNLHLYQSIDLPVAHILHRMEETGIKIDIHYLASLSTELTSKITSLEQQIYEEAGKQFNIASPKQLGTILFDEMQLPFGKIKGKSASYSTNVEILEKLKLEGHKIADLLLEYRHLSKLKNTYIDPLPKQATVNEERIHTTFLQCSTSTSRLSSINPNIQNIPIRTKEGSKVRKSFIAKEGHKLISADYSQIELRILSHVANISALKDAFHKDTDIHALTASQIFKIPLQEITSEIRRKAKAINFSIIYGISAFGLAKQLNIGQKEAAQYIELYFQEYPGIKQYMEDTIKFAQQNLFVSNLIGRRCHLPLINDKSHALRSFAQRAAINAPMQSLASEIVKIAMIKVDKALTDKQLKTKMILQIHDELIFEAPDSEVESVMALIKNIMEEPLPIPNAEPIKFNVDIKFGQNWQEI